MQIRKDILVFKAGGSVIAAPGDFAPIAEYLVGKQRDGSRVAVVLSAMSGWTDQLRGFAQLIHPDALEDPELRAHADVSVTAGEKVATGLMALAIHRAGGQAASFEGHQIGLRTTGAPGSAVIEAIEGIDVVNDALIQGRIACIPGYQVVDRHGRILTLRRGGTDASAVAVAYGLGARDCVCFKDVAGIYTAPPTLVSGARRFRRLDYSWMRRMRSQVLMDEAVEMAEKHQVRIRVQLAPNISWPDQESRPEGTLVGYPDLEPGRLLTPEPPVAFLRVQEGLAQLKISDRAITIELLRQVTGSIRAAGVSLVQVRSSVHDAVLLVMSEDRERTDAAVRAVYAGSLTFEDGYATVTLIDETMSGQVGYYDRVLHALQSCTGVDPRDAWAPEDVIMVIVRQEQVGPAAQALADEFGLTDEEGRE